MAWNRSQDEPEVQPVTPSRSSTSGSVATLGPSISIRGDLTGSEDLRIEGSVEGTIRLDKQSVMISGSGRIKADIYSRRICVEGEVQGNLNGEEEVIIRPSGKLEGNIIAPSVTLENGAKFRGSIDMEPTKASKASPATESTSKQPARGSNSRRETNDKSKASTVIGSRHAPTAAATAAASAKS